MKPIERLEPWNKIEYVGSTVYRSLTPAETKINELVDAVNALMPAELDKEIIKTGNEMIKEVRGEK